MGILLRFYDLDHTTGADEFLPEKENKLANKYLSTQTSTRTELTSAPDSTPADNKIVNYSHYQSVNA